ncbi:MAG TPA: hypothetical protein VKE42_00135, partial [Candidatus Cybelea sp.]|nr:hypothetical protein [Candidatus Cybelea sp.]
MTLPHRCDTRLRAAGACVVLCATFWVAACAGKEPREPASSTPALALEATIGSAPAEATEALVMWNVTSSDPHYLYLWGRANVEGDSFKLALQSRPPSGAMNDDGLGVGMILLVLRSAGVRDGMQLGSDDSLYKNFRGASERQVIIYVDREQAREDSLFDFPQGYSCGDARAAQSGETSDTYAP